MSSWTTDANGQYTFPVLNSGTYVIKETSAPVGFELPTLNIPDTTAGTGTTYVTRKNRRNDPNRLTLRKYDPVVKRHVEFREER